MSEFTVSRCRRAPRVGTAIFAAVLFGGVLAGCSSASGEAGATAAPSVASLPSTPAAQASATATKAAAAVEGPLIRADTTTEEFERLQWIWGKCLRAQGVPGITKQVMMKMSDSLLTGHADAVAACASKKPERVVDRFQREHPQQAQAHLRQFIKCMQNAGQKIIFIAPDGWGVSDQQAAAGYTPDERIWAKCEQKAYGA